MPGMVGSIFSPCLTVHQRVFSTLGDYMSTLGAYRGHDERGGYHSTRGYSVHWRDTTM